MSERRIRARPDPGYAAAGLVSFAALTGWLVATFLTAPHGQRLIDLAVYRDAGRSVLDGRGVYTHLTAPPQQLGFTYPPFSALLSVPLAIIPFGLAGWLWTIGELILTPVITWFGFRRLWPRLGLRWPVALGVLAGLMQQLLPFRDEIKFGQADELVVVLCVLDLLATREARWFARLPRGVLIGLATAIKLTPAVFIPYLWLTGRTRAALTAAGTFVVAELLALAVTPHDSVKFWTDALFHTSRLQPNDGTANQSVRGMLLRAHLPHIGFLIVLAVALAGVAVVGYARAMRASRAGDELAAVAIVGLLAVLLSPVAWIHHLVWLPLVLGAIVAGANAVPRVAGGATAYLFFVARIPWAGRHMLHTAWPLLVARVVEDGFGLAALALLLLVPVGSNVDFVTPDLPSARSTIWASWTTASASPRARPG